MDWVGVEGKVWGGGGGGGVMVKMSQIARNFVSLMFDVEVVENSGKFQQQNTMRQHRHDRS